MQPSLNEQLAALRAEKDGARDPAYTAIMTRATEELVASDILDRVPAPGDRAPLFARPDLNGETVRLRSLLRRGPVVASFFRGRW
jgi:hypothetical protein